VVSNLIRQEDVERFSEAAGRIVRKTAVVAAYVAGAAR